MFFWKQKKEIILDCFTWSNTAYEYAKIDYASKFFPDWWKNLPKTKTILDRGNAKNCVAIKDYYRKGIIIPSWFEMNLVIRSYKNQDQSFAWEASNPDVNTDNCHTREQFDGFSIDKNYISENIKFSSPWRMSSKSDTYFTWTQPVWNQKDIASHLTLLPAVIEYKYQQGTEINYMIVRREEDVIINIPPLTPLVILHPMSDKKIVLKHHLLSREEFDNRLGEKMFLFSHDLYKKKKTFFKATEKKCPFYHN